MEVSKRTFGHMREAVFIAGVELLEDTPLDAMVVGVCEGVADALAIRKLEGIPAIACCSTPHPSRAPDLARFGGVQVYTDVGEGERQAGEFGDRHKPNCRIEYCEHQASPDRQRRG